MKYELEWHYSDRLPPSPDSEPIHFGFMLRFPEVPPGKGHCAHFCFNVLQKPETSEPGISVVRRGFLVCVPFSKPVIQKFVETTVADSYNANPHDEALTQLNEKFINSDIDFSAEFAEDLIGESELLTLIHKAFEGVERGAGVTLHQAMVTDRYGSLEDFLAAAKLDVEARWQDVPDSAIAANPGFFNFLDQESFRYYLPAAMSWSLTKYINDENDSGFFTYLAVLPTVAPREIGRGMGAAYDLDKFIGEHSFSPAQVNAIYRFICFMAIRAELGMDEDQYAAVQKWRQAALAYTESKIE